LRPSLRGWWSRKVKYHSGHVRILTRTRESDSGTVFGGQFIWGGFLPKSNGGVPRHPQRGWQSRVERKGIWVLNCETDQVEQM
jgi:hypothetical protein